MKPLHSNSLLISLLILFGLLQKPAAIAQIDTVSSGITASDSATLSIVSIAPDSFPKVSVVFKAQDKNGEPFWDMTQSQIKIAENGNPCSLVSLEQISKNKAINIALVVDHSGSMRVDMDQLYHADGSPKFEYNIFTGVTLPHGYVSPMESAKKALTSFVTGLDTTKDFVSIIGFSSTVDVQLPLTNSIAEINATLTELEPDNKTAFYDALLAGIASVKDATGINLVLALTDGNDNTSKSNVPQVIDSAKAAEVPLYVIGLGDISPDPLQQIATETGGDFEYTQSSKSLVTVYENIRSQIQAFYNLVYTSNNLQVIDSTRTVYLTYEPQQGISIGDQAQAVFPVEVIAFLAKQKREKQLLIYGGTTVAVIGLGLLVFVIARKRKKRAQA